MQFNANQYEPFLEMTARDYCKARIEAHVQEIEQAGLQVLTDGVIAPAGIAVEVLYLDRSEGDAVTPHIFVPDGTNLPTIRLLYRP
jgi:ubiquitin thioesterase protein OTUB1